MGQAKKLKMRKKEVKTRIKNVDLIGVRRKQIIEGAIKVFIAKGFQSATVREIADAAGLTMGSLYNYIGSKEDIIYIVYDYITSLLREDMKVAISGIKDPEERLKAALRHNVNAVYKNQDIIMFIYKESSFLDKESLYTVLARETEYIEMFEDLLREYFRKDGKKVNETRLRIAADLLSYIPVILTLRRWSLRRRFESMDIVMKSILDFVLSAIQFVPERGGRIELERKRHHAGTNKKSTNRFL
jgi:AcrR family transcriptional regulator